MSILYLNAFPGKAFPGKAFPRKTHDTLFSMIGPLVVSSLSLVETTKNGTSYPSRSNASVKTNADSKNKPFAGESLHDSSSSSGLLYCH